MYALMLCTHFV